MKTIFSKTGAVALLTLSLASACSDDETSSNTGTGSGGDTATGGNASGGKGGSSGENTGGKGGAGTGGTGTGGMGTGGAGTGGAGTGGTGTGGATTDAGTKPPPTLGAMIDRMGRPAINTALNHTFDTDATAKGAAKDAYNQAMPANWGSFKAEFQKNLAILDALDANCGNQLLAAATATPDRYATLAGVLTDDQLYVNTGTGQCGVYLGVEAEAVSAVGAGVGKCGGRTPKDDVIERSYSVLAAGVLSGVDDTITADDGAQTATFPFLGPPTTPDGG